MSFNLVKFIKVMKMTSSSHEGEALAALRTATRMMAAAKVTWDDILKPTVTTNQQKPRDWSRPTASPYQQGFDYAWADESSSMKAYHWQVLQELMRREAERQRAREQAKQANSNPYANSKKPWDIP